MPTANVLPQKITLQKKLFYQQGIEVNGSEK